MSVLTRLFPVMVDNTYHGNKLGRWLLFLYIFKSLFAGSVHLLAPDGGAQSIARITLNQFSQGASDTVVTMFAMWGMEQLLIGLFGVLIFTRYQALLPLMSLAYVFEYFGRCIVAIIKPGVNAPEPPPGVVVDQVLVPLTIVMLLLTLHRKEDKAA